MRCKICETRKPRRYCPGVQGDICSICCGNEREVTVPCPLDCAYLREAHARETPVELNPGIPNADIQVPERFLIEQQRFLSGLGAVFHRAIGNADGVVDSDLREALDALTRTYRTLSNGLIYDSHPMNPFADRIYRAIREWLQGRKERDADILGCLVFFQRAGLRLNNGRVKGRWFIEFLLREFQAEAAGVAEPDSPSLIEL